MASDLKPPSVNNGTLSEGGRSLFASESSLRAARLQCGSQVPAEYFALSVEATALLSLSSHPFQYDTVSHREMSAVSQEERKKKGRSTVVVHLLLLKISLVKFSLSQRLAAQNQGLQGVKGRRGRPRDQKEKEKKGGGRWRVEAETDRASK